jgi:hypothetical protein
VRNHPKPATLIGLLSPVEVAEMMENGWIPNRLVSRERVESARIIIAETSRELTGSTRKPKDRAA